MIPFGPEALLSHGYCQPEPRGRVATLRRGPWTKVGQGTRRTGRVQPVVCWHVARLPYKSLLINVNYCSCWAGQKKSTQK
jgi:hypothetical protein